MKFLNFVGQRSTVNGPSSGAGSVLRPRVTWRVWVTPCVRHVAPTILSQTGSAGSAVRLLLLLATLLAAAGSLLESSQSGSTPTWPQQW